MKLEDLLLYIDTGHISLSSYLPFITACVFFPHVDVARLTLNSWQWTFWLFFYSFLLFLRGSTLKQLDWR